MRRASPPAADQRIFFLGVESVSIDIANMIVEAMIDGGLKLQDVQSRITMFDVNGLTKPSRQDLSPSHKAGPTRDLKAAMEAAKPTVLIGVSTKGDTSIEEVVGAMAENVDRLIIFPLPNPTEQAQCTPKHATAWTDVEAIVAWGVQFSEATVGGKTCYPGQADNFYILPAIGLAVWATRPKRTSDKMFIEIARASADQVSQDDRDKSIRFPRQSAILKVEITTTTRVAEYIFDQGLVTVEISQDVRAWIKGLTYKPSYEERS